MARGRELPEVTLRLLLSVDGKVTSGATEDASLWEDLPRVLGNRVGVQQYNELGIKSGTWDLTTGKSLIKSYANQQLGLETERGTNIVVVDNQSLTVEILRQLTKQYTHVFVAHSASSHCAYRCRLPNVIPVEYPTGDLRNLFRYFTREFGCTSLLARTGGTFNAVMFEQGLVDTVELLVAPVIVGGSRVPGLSTGPHLSELGMNSLCPLLLKEAVPMRNSFLYLRYSVLKRQL